MANHLYLTDNQTEVLKVLALIHLANPDLTYEFASALYTIVDQVDSEASGKFLIDLQRYVRAEDWPICVVCFLADPQVKQYDDKPLCPRHAPLTKDEKDEELLRRVVLKLFSIAEIAEYYLPGELGEMPHIIRDDMQMAQDVLLAIGYIDKPRLYQQEFGRETAYDTPD